MVIGAVVAFLSEMIFKSEESSKKSKKKYYEAYIRSNFYKDLLAHDIKNILQNILSSTGLASLYLKDLKKLNEAKNLLSIAGEQVQRGAHLISNVRKLSQLEESEVSLRSIDIFTVLKKAIKYLREISQEEKVFIKVESSYEKAFVQANEFLLDVFENILLNAVKFNDKQIPEILIRISKVKKWGFTCLKMEFLDNGIGLPDTKKEIIFQRIFKKEKNDTGMGIGLSLVKKILNCYIGNIWVEDRVKGNYSKGSNFVILIPEGV